MRRCPSPFPRNFINHTHLESGVHIWAGASLHFKRSPPQWICFVCSHLIWHSIYALPYLSPRLKWAIWIEIDLRSIQLNKPNLKTSHYLCRAFSLTIRCHRCSSRRYPPPMDTPTRTSYPKQMWAAKNVHMAIKWLSTSRMEASCSTLNGFMTLAAMMVRLGMRSLHSASSRLRLFMSSPFKCRALVRAQLWM